MMAKTMEMRSKSIAEVWENCDITKKKSEGSRNTSSQMSRNVGDRPAGQSYFEEKTKVNDKIITQQPSQFTALLPASTLTWCTSCRCVDSCLVQVHSLLVWPLKMLVWNTGTDCWFISNLSDCLTGCLTKCSCLARQQRSKNLTLEWTDFLTYYTPENGSSIFTK